MFTSLSLLSYFCQCRPNLKVIVIPQKVTCIEYDFLMTMSLFSIMGYYSFNFPLLRLGDPWGCGCSAIYPIILIVFLVFSLFLEFVHSIFRIISLYLYDNIILICSCLLFFIVVQETQLF